jgi:hypothetical protein
VADQQVERVGVEALGHHVGLAVAGDVGHRHHIGRCCGNVALGRERAVDGVRGATDETTAEFSAR